MGAEARGLRLYRAVTDDRSCRRAYIVHAALEDLPTQAIEPQLRRVIERAARRDVAAQRSRRVFAQAW